MIRYLPVVSNADEFEREGKSLARSGRFGAVHWLIILLSLIVTFIAWYGASSSMSARTEQRFDREVDRVMEQFDKRLQRYEDVLRASVATVASGGSDLSMETWERFSAKLALLDQFPAITSLGVMQHVLPDELPTFLAEQRRLRPGFRLSPTHDQPYHLPIIHLAPPSLERFLGRDMAFDAVRRQAAIRAAYLNDVQITAPITLANDGNIGFAMFAPFYRNGANPPWQDRKQEFRGTIVSSVVASDLVKDVLDEGRRPISLRISDGEKLLYDESAGTNYNADPDPAFIRTISTEVFGRHWTFTVSSSLAFRQEVLNQTPLYILAGGLAVDGLLLVMFTVLTRTNRRAISLAQATTRELREKAARLEESNSELESFAYVVSHDLKTPLRGIRDLASYIEEDLDDCLKDVSVPAEVPKNFARLYKQVTRANTLIDGILTYSGIGTEEERTTRVDVRELVDEIRQTLNLAPERLRLEGDFPVFDTFETRLSQVLANLIGNAFKYHHDPTRAVTRVACLEVPGFYRFSVIDDGPGIDHRFHERIFDPFKTLQSQDDIESTGVGLSIVKKTVELIGGTVSVSSTVGQGTTFLFDWPKDVPESMPSRSMEPSCRRAA